MKKMTAILLDDEVDAIQNLRFLLDEMCPALEIIYTSTSPIETLKWIKKNKAPDFFFSDIEMPGINGFELIELLDALESKIIFVSAYDHFAIKAIDYQPFAYLLKPLDINDVKKVYEKAINTFQEKEKNERSNILKIPNSEGIKFINIADICFVKAERSYATIHFTDGEKLLVSKNLSWVASQIHSEHFLRCHKSYLVNQLTVSSFLRKSGGFLIMKTGDEIPVSSSYKDYFSL